MTQYRVNPVRCNVAERLEYKPPLMHSWVWHDRSCGIAHQRANRDEVEINGTRSIWRGTSAAKAALNVMQFRKQTFWIDAGLESRDAVAKVRLTWAARDRFGAIPTGYRYESKALDAPEGNERSLAGHKRTATVGSGKISAECDKGWIHPCCHLAYSERVV